MPMVCAVYGCSNRSNREKNKGYFRVPKVVVHKGKNHQKLTEKRRQAWIQNLSLQSGGVESDNARVCSDHFVNGCPSAVKDVNSTDWAPTVHLGYQRGKPMTEAARLQEERLKSRETDETRTDAAAASLDLGEIAKNPESEYLKDAGCKTDLTMDDLEKMEDVVTQASVVLSELRTKELDTQFTQEAFQNNEDMTKFYTGLPNFLVLMQVFKLCEPHITSSTLCALSKFEQFVLVLLRLRLNLSLQDLSIRFKVSCSTISRIWHKVIDILHERLEFIIEWPEREVLQETMPMSFRQAFGCKVAVIVDCFEVFIERPSNLLARAQTWSSYKHHNTVKFLIGVAPQGYVTYISRAWGGRVSDKQITEESDLLKNLLPGDIVLADRGFNVGDSVGFYCASLKMPAFTKGKSQLSAFGVEQTRKLANVRIHVERVMGFVRRKYQILQSRAMPIEHIHVKPGDQLALIEKIGVICCALANLCDSVVPLE